MEVVSVKASINHPKQLYCPQQMPMHSGRFREQTISTVPLFDSVRR